MIIIDKRISRVLLIVKAARKSSNKTFRKSIISEKKKNIEKIIIKYIFKIKKI